MARPLDTTPEALADANLLIAFLAGAGHPSHGAAAAILERMDRGGLRVIVDPIIVAEIVWASPAALGRPRESVAALLIDLLASDGFDVTDRRTVSRALRLQVENPRLDFADAWLAARATGPGTLPVASFDRDLDVVAGVQRVTS